MASRPLMAVQATSGHWSAPKGPQRSLPLGPRMSPILVYCLFVVYLGRGWKRIGLEHRRYIDLITPGKETLHPKPASNLTTF